MSDAKKADVNIILPSQAIDKTKEKSESSGFDNEEPTSLKEMPTVSTLLARKRLAVKSAAPNVASKAAQTPLPPVSSAPVPAAKRAAQPFVQKKLSEPPKFCKSLVLEKLDLKTFQKKLRLHSRSTDMKKLVCLGYFASRFSEIAYFEMTEEKMLQGVLGFGNAKLVSEIQKIMVSASVLPGVFDLLTQSEAYVGAIEGLRHENKQPLEQIGFQQTSGVAIFPVVMKKAIVGVWICTAAQVETIAPQEMKSVKALLADTVVTSRRFWFW